MYTYTHFFGYILINVQYKTQQHMMSRHDVSHKNSWRNENTLTEKLTPNLSFYCVNTSYLTDSRYMSVPAGPPNVRKRHPGFTPGRTGTSLSTH